ncbi:SMP-30/gluconolactonase/LRE family protein [Zavarzinella formosa]|uniref:SMP-30/gluconolactonase/LRE family protein n=1 Tax=Zavarzinella formosa TaxID=360055 RepID=UPI0012FC7C97|nr:SMP-30/gluconolactonase/LRE family protein [Zavarzinella formosa]
MTIPTVTARVLFHSPTPADGFLPEGPRQVTFNGRSMLGWVNIQTAPEATTGTLWLRDWETGETLQFPLPGRPGFFLPTDMPDVVLVGLTKQIGLFDLNAKTWTMLGEIPDKNPRTIINDAEITPDGRYAVFGTKDTLFKDTIAQLFLFDIRAKTIHVLADGQTCSNGKILHADGDDYIFYDIDTPTREVRKYRLQVAPPKLEYLSTPLDLRNEIGFPDGMVDAGNQTALIAFYNPDHAEHGLGIAYDLNTGKRVYECHMPGSPRVTCPLLVERESKSLAVFTTALEDMPSGQMVKSPSAGDLFFTEIENLLVPKPVLAKTNG